MKKIQEIVKGVSESVKASYKEKRIQKALDTAYLNAQEELDMAKAALEEFPSTAADMTAESIISHLSTLIVRRNDAQYSIDVLNEVKEYLDTEVEE